MKINITKRSCLVVLTMAMLLASRTASAHFPWLTASKDGNADLFFGEDLSDRDYHMPDAIAAAKVMQFDGGASQVVKMKASEAEGFAGMVSVKPCTAAALLCEATYGVHRGSRLNYYTLHYAAPLETSTAAHLKKFAKLPLPLVAHVIKTDEGVDVLLKWNGKPLAENSVSLYSAEGEKKSTVKTGKDGRATFTVGELEKGLNGLVAGFSVKDEKGEYEGKKYEGAMHYLTATFHHDDKRYGQKKAAKPAAETTGSKAGGKPDANPHAKAEAGSQVKLHTPLPEAITSFGGAVVGEYLYVFSGHDGAAHGFSKDGLSDHFRRIRYDDPAAKWEELAMHEAAQSTALVTDGKHIYRVGGLTFLNEEGEDTNFKSTTHFARYNIAEDKWTELAPLPEPRSSLDAAVVGRTIFAAGGWNLQGASSGKAPWHETILSFNLDKPEAGWQTLPGPGYKTRAASVAAHNGKLYLFGGIQQRGITRKVSVFDPATSKWSAGPELHADSSSAGFATSSFATGGHLYVTGNSGVLYRLSEDGKQWENAGRLLFPRMFLRLLPVSDTRLIAVGGTSSTGGRTAAIESIEVGSKPQPRIVRWSVKFGGRAKHSQTLVLSGSKLFAIGGNASRAPHDFSKEAFVDESFVFDIPRQEAKQLPNAPRPLQSAAGVLHRVTSKHHKIMVAGGLGYGEKGLTSLDSVYALDPQFSEWSTAEVKLPQPRGMFSGVAQGDALWYFGGSTKNRGLATSVLHWWGDSSEITPLPAVKLPTPRRSAAGAVAGNQYFVLGGLAEGSEIASDVDVFNFETRTWSKAPSPKRSRVFPSAVATPDTIYLAGGFSRVDGHFAPAPSIEAYDLEKKTWRTVAQSLPGVTGSMKMLNYGDRLLFYGVDSKEDGVAQFVLFDPAPTAQPAKVKTMSFSRRSSSDTGATILSLMKLDADKDGQLTAEELGKRLGDLLEKGDADGNGKLSYSEVRAVVTKKEK